MSNVSINEIHGFTDAKEAYDAVGFGTGDLIIREYSLQAENSGVNYKKAESVVFSDPNVTLNDYVVIGIAKKRGDWWMPPNQVIGSSIVLPYVDIIGNGIQNDIYIKFNAQSATDTVRVRVVLLRIANRG